MKQKQKFTKAQILMIAERVLNMPFENVWKMYRLGLLRDDMLNYNWCVAMWMDGTIKRLPNPPKRHPCWKRAKDGGGFNPPPSISSSPDMGII